MMRENAWDVTFDSETVMVRGRIIDSEAMDAVMAALSVYRDLLAGPNASGIEARSDETAQQAQPEGQEPDPQGDAQGLSHEGS